MAQITQYINFIVYFNNPEDYATATGLGGGNTAQMTPKEVADLFGFVDGVNFNTGGALNSDKGMYGIPPYGIPTVAPGVEVMFPLASGVYVMWDQDNILVPAQAGNPSSVFPPGPDLLLQWCAVFVLQEADVESEPTTAPIPKRRWAIGFEIESTGEGVTSGVSTLSRASSRTLEGVGMPIRENSSQQVAVTTNKYITPVNARASWERFYLRVNQIGTEEVRFWTAAASPQPLNGAILALADVDGSNYVINCYNRDFNTPVFIGSKTLPFNAYFHKLDILLNFGSGGSTTGRFRLYVDGTLAVDVVCPTNQGMGTNSTHGSSQLGIIGANESNGWEYDLDDWHNAEIPNVGGVESLNSPDWFVGTHIQLQKSSTVDVGTWTGPARAVDQLMNPSNHTGISELVSTTSGDILEVVTDADDSIDSVFTPLGTYICTAALRAIVYASRTSGIANSQLGYKLAGGSAVLTNVSLSASPLYREVFYPGTGVDILPATIVPASAVFIKSADGVQNTVQCLGLEVQYVGIWGSGDGVVGLSELYYQHNAFYPGIATAFMFEGGATPGPTLMAVVGGTYTGNDDVNVISLPLPAHFIYIRPVGVQDPGALFFGAALASHFTGRGNIHSDLITRVDFDPITQTSSFTVCGNDSNNNQNGTTYQYIAICDPAYRFCVCGAYSHHDNVTGAINPLLIASSGYTPVAGFIQGDNPTVFATPLLGYKGVGHTGTTGNAINGNVLADMGEFGDGTWLSGIDFDNSHAECWQVDYCFLRPDDGCAYTMFYFTSYTGDGNNPRTINFSPTTGRYPLFVFVQPHNGVAYVKDPSDAANSARSMESGTSSATAITAVGMDSITVSSQLNSNGIVYDVWVILGDDAGMNNGIYFPSLCNPNPRPDDPPPVEVADIDIVTDGGLVLNGITPLTLLRDASGIYTLVKNLHHDELLNRLPEQDDVNVKIPDPTFKTGYIGG